MISVNYRPSIARNPRHYEYTQGYPHQYGQQQQQQPQHMQHHQPQHMQYHQPHHMQQNQPQHMPQHNQQRRYTHQYLQARGSYQYEYRYPLPIPHSPTPPHAPVAGGPYWTCNTPPPSMMQRHVACITPPPPHSLNSPTNVFRSAPPKLHIVPHQNDVLMGRGGKNNMHLGNEQLRKMARSLRDAYIKASKKEKSKMSRTLVKQVHELKPPGRFLKRDPVTALWEVVDIEYAREKTSQCLRDAVSVPGYTTEQEKKVEEDPDRPTTPANVQEQVKTTKVADDNIVTAKAVGDEEGNDNIVDNGDIAEDESMKDLDVISIFKDDDLDDWVTAADDSMADFFITDFF